MLLLSLGAAAPESVAVQAAEGETLRYRVNYEGLLSAAVPVEIAQVSLTLHPAVQSVDGEQLRRASLALTTEPFPRMEALYPLRLKYDSWFDPELRYSAVVDMRRQSSKSRHELLWFNRKEGVVRSYRKRKGKEGKSAATGLPEFLLKISHLQQPSSFRERRVRTLDSGDVLDRLAMLYALRKHPLVPGEVVEMAVSNGKDLLGYKVAVEAREQLLLDGQMVATLRLRLTPSFAAGADRGYAVRVWLSDDELRLPLRFRSSEFGGAIELNLESPVDRSNVVTSQ